MVVGLSKQKICRIMYQGAGYLIPSKKARKSFRNWYRYKTINFKQIQKNYEQHLATLKTKQQIKIAFLVWENCKWSYASLYRLFALNSKYDPYVVIVRTENPLCDFDKNLDFFKKGDYHVISVTSSTELKDLGVDIVFYEQPWFSLKNSFCPEKVSEFALCFYVPYGIEMDIHDCLIQCTKPFYSSLYRTFILNEAVRSEMAKHGITNVVVVGHPRLDNFLAPVQKDMWQSKGKVRIIYAPHHSFKHSMLKWATYEWNGDHLLELAKKYADTTEWFFKPHPRFYVALTEEFGSEYADKVFADWACVSKLCDSGDYYDLFRTADIMISDCGSFKIEWLPTLKPYLNLVSSDPDTEKPGPIEQHFLSAYYHAHNCDELDEYFDLLVNQKKDPLKAEREALLREIPMNTSQKIYDYINELSKAEK